MFKHVSNVPLRSQNPSSPSHFFHSETLLPLTFPISQHSWAVPHQSKGQFMGLMLQRVQTGLWDRMFGWYPALLKQTSHQNMITEGRGNRFLVLLQCIQAILMSTKYHCFTCFHMFKSRSPNDNKVNKCLTSTTMACGKSQQGRHWLSGIVSRSEKKKLNIHSYQCGKNITNSNASRAIRFQCFVWVHISVHRYCRIF